MKSIRLACITLFFALSSTQVTAADFEAALSSDTAQFTFRSDSSVIGWGGSDLGLGVFYNDESDFVFNGSLMQMRQASEEDPLTLGVGVNAYIGTLDGVDADIAALAVGGEIRYTIPGTMPMAVYGRLWYAPSITSFSDADGILDYTIGFQIEALPQTIAFVGIRNFEVDTDDDGDYELDDGNVHIGVRLTF